MESSSACKVVGTGGVGESGSSEMLTHQVKGTTEKIVVLRRGSSSLCPNTGAVGLLLVNGRIADQGIMTEEGASIQANARPSDQVVAIVYMFPLFNSIACVRLGELEVTLEECDLVTRTDYAGCVISSACVESRNWYAWNNKMPPPPDDFHVVGEVDVPNPGVDVRLLERSPQGFNPAHLLMDLVLFQQPGIWPQVVTTKQVRYDKILVNSNYEQVHVFQNQKLAAKIPVETVS